MSIVGGALKFGGLGLVNGILKKKKAAKLPLSPMPSTPPVAPPKNGSGVPQINGGDRSMIPTATQVAPTGFSDAFRKRATAINEDIEMRRRRRRQPGGVFGDEM